MPELHIKCLQTYIMANDRRSMRLVVDHFLSKNDAVSDADLESIKRAVSLVTSYRLLKLEGMKALLKLRKGLAESDRIKEIDNIVDPRHWLNELERPHSCLFDVSLASEEQRCKNFLSLLVRVESCQAPFSFIDWHPDCKSVSILDRDDLIEVVPSNKKQALIQLFKLENAYSGASSNQVIQQSLLAIPSNSNSVEPISEFKSEPVPSVAVGSPPPYQENGFFTNPQLQIDGGLAQLSATLENLKSLQQRFPQHRILQAANVMIEDFKTSQSSNQNERLVAPKFK